MILTSAFDFCIWPSELTARVTKFFAHVVHCPLFTVTFQQYYVIGCGLPILVYFFSMFTACYEELESPVGARCHLQAPSGVEAIKWTDLMFSEYIGCLLTELQSTTVWTHAKVLLRIHVTLIQMLLRERMSDFKLFYDWMIIVSMICKFVRSLAKKSRTQNIIT